MIYLFNLIYFLFHLQFNAHDLACLQKLDCSIVSVFHISFTICYREFGSIVKGKHSKHWIMR